MKLFILTLFVLTLSVAAQAQLNNTKWVGSIAAPADVDVVVAFKNDTLNITMAGTDNVLESMKYTVKDDVITVFKISGGSPCSANQAATLKYTIKDDRLVLVPITDPCDERKNAWPIDGFTRQQ